MSFMQAFLAQANFNEDGGHPPCSAEDAGATLKADPRFNAAADAAELEKAIKAKGVDEATIIDILTKRTNAERQQIRAAYQNATGKSLDEALKKALKSHLEEVVLALMKTPAQYDAHELNAAMKGLGTDEDTLVEILVSRTNSQMKEINCVYKTESKMSFMREFLLQAAFLDDAQHKGDSAGGVKGAAGFNASEDANNLDKAIKAKGVDEASIINILIKRSNAQRQAIKEAYLKSKGKSLDETLKTNLSGPIKEIILALLLTPAECDAESLKAATKGLGTDEATLIEILVTRTNQQIKAIKKAYHEAYKTELEKDIAEDTSGDFQKTLLALLKAQRSEDCYVNEDLANEDAKALYEAGEKNKKVDAEVFIKIFTSCSEQHLREVFKKYGNYSKHDVNSALDLKLKGDFERCLVAIVKYVTNGPAFFAEKLHLAMKIRRKKMRKIILLSTGFFLAPCVFKGIGIREKIVTRIMVSRSEIDMKNIKAQYKELYKISLREAFLKETKEDYQTVLIALCGYDD
uniref:Annexin n=1 Tax=Leptobrachium leishanense TaxID=445787 RepID=A0A8C5N139_9ANUR